MKFESKITTANIIFISPLDSTRMIFAKKLITRKLRIFITKGGEMQIVFSLGEWLKILFPAFERLS